MAEKSRESVLDRIFELFRQRGENRYGGEDVSQTQHALQAALAAEREGATDALIVAALLHDLGHLLHQLPDDCADHGIDDQHEELACRWLMRHFPNAVTEPIRLHVAAKRYLCATDPHYLAELSDASRQSLALQGGPFTAEQAREFESHPHFEASIRLRQWDEVAKVRDLVTPDLNHYRPILQRVATGA